MLLAAKQHDWLADMNTESLFLPIRPIKYGILVKL